MLDTFYRTGEVKIWSCWFSVSLQTSKIESCCSCQTHTSIVHERATCFELGCLIKTLLISFFQFPYNHFEPTALRPKNLYHDPLRYFLFGNHDMKPDNNQNLYFAYLNLLSVLLTCSYLRFLVIHTFFLFSNYLFYCLAITLGIL